ncbi:cytochrome P450 [Xylaria bambusicola]|uniref:cytochrome P450 n=1 Tax=Xylaria bambusicola TaxID=326684 RepID=UPI002008C5A3|nr:cytochrome P450 [Xylaria bambusicola]KAI0508831.1 cytochrome P450 [Xylaria bambusicola]
MDVTQELLKSNHVYTLGALGLVAILLLLSSTLSSPLSRVPGPWYTRFTDVVGRLHWMAGRKAPYIHNLHQKYGPIVRVGPREVYIADPQVVKSIFKVKNEFPKSRWYLDFVPFTITVFNTPDIPTHRRFRRLLSAPLSESGLKEFMPQIEQKVNLAIQGMAEEHKTRGAADIYKWWLYLTTDVIGELSFGESFRMLETNKINQYITDLQGAGKFGSYRSAFPSLFRFSYRFGIPLPMSSAAQAAVRRIRMYADESISRHRAIVEREGPDSRPTVFTKVYKAEDEASITQDEIRDHAQAYIVAGSDTTSNTLTYLVWAVCRNSKVKSRLVKELEVLPDDFAYEDLQQAHISYLEHVIDEVLRRFPAAPSGLPREVPQGGAELCGYHIPAGYTVTTQNYSLHRDPDAFPDPEKFDPSRWENTTQAMKDAFLPFGGGSRVCIGLHLAKIELRLGVARFFKKFPNAKMSSLEGMTDEDMVPKLFFLINPQGHRCLMELE